MGVEPTDNQLLRTPELHSLLERLRKANQRAAVLLVIEVMLSAVLVCVIDWPQLLRMPSIVVLAVLCVLGPSLGGMIFIFSQNKKEISKLKEQTRFGEFDKHRLKTLFLDTLGRLRLPQSRLAVYITADKSMNAASVQVGMGSLFNSLNGIYLNRQLLHRLSPEEVQGIMGHELGHYYRYYLVAVRYQVCLMLLAVLAGISLAQTMGLSIYGSSISVAAIPAGCWWLSGILRADHGQTIEYLCDHLGAQVQGVEASVTGLLKLGADAELQYAIHEHFLLSNKMAADLPSAEIIRSIEASLSYGQPTREQLEAAIELELKKQTAKHNEIGLAGFLNYAWNGDEDKEESLQQMRQISQALNSRPRLKWEEVLEDPYRIELDRFGIGKLVALIEANPQSQLFRFPEPELGTHPPLKRRILFLWRNRDAALIS